MVQSEQYFWGTINKNSFQTDVQSEKFLPTLFVLLKTDIRHTRAPPQRVRRPISDDRVALGQNVNSVEVSEKNACLVRSEEDENMPHTVHVREAKRLPHGTEETIAEPRRKSDDPHETTTQAEMINSPWRTPVHAYNWIFYFASLFEQ